MLKKLPIEKIRNLIFEYKNILRDNYKLQSGFIETV